MAITLGPNGIVSPFGGNANGIIAASAAPIASTSGAVIDTLNIPSWAKRVTIGMNGVSLSGTALVLIQIGNGAVITSGYVGSSANLASTVTNNASVTNGFQIGTSSLASDVISGIAELINIGSNTWVCRALMSADGASGTRTAAGKLALSTALDRVRLTSSNGTDTFDSGSFNVFWE